MRMRKEGRDKQGKVWLSLALPAGHLLGEILLVHTTETIDFHHV